MGYYHGEDPWQWRGTDEVRQELLRHRPRAAKEEPSARRLPRRRLPEARTLLRVAEVLFGGTKNGRL